MNCIHPPSLTLPRCRYMGSAWLSKAASWCCRPVATDQPVEKQNKGRICNFFAIRNCSSSPIAVKDVKTAGNQPYSSLFARSRDGKESLIAKKLHKSRIFCFWVPEVAARKLRGGVAVRLRFD